MALIDFLNENYYVLVPALWVIGAALKRTPSIPDWSIIWILLGFSLVFGTISFGFTMDAVINGVIAAGVSVFGHQMVKQTVEARNGNGNGAKNLIEDQEANDKGM